MNSRKKNKISSKSLRENLLKGTRTAVNKLIKERKKGNGFLVVSKNGKVKKIRARSIK
jgi:hypothetical protein